MINETDTKKGNSMDLNRQLIEAMADLNEDLVIATVRQMAAEGHSFEEIQQCLNTGISAVGTRFERGDYFIADLIVSGMIYRSALNEREPLRSGGAPRPLGKVVIGVVAGDIHDIGKDIIVSLLRAERFDVVDLGIDVKPERFVHAVRNYHPDVVLLSGVLTTAQEAMVQTIQALTDAGLRDQVKVLIGGLCTSEYLMHHVGADGLGLRQQPNRAVLQGGSGCERSSQVSRRRSMPSSMRLCGPRSSRGSTVPETCCRRRAICVRNSAPAGRPCAEACSSWKMRG